WPRGTLSDFRSTRSRVVRAGHDPHGRESPAAARASNATRLTGHPFQRSTTDRAKRRLRGCPSQNPSPPVDPRARDACLRNRSALAATRRTSVARLPVQSVGPARRAFARTDLLALLVVLLTCGRNRARSLPPTCVTSPRPAQE